MWSYAFNVPQWKIDWKLLLRRVTSCSGSTETRRWFNTKRPGAIPERELERHSEHRSAVHTPTKGPHWYDIFSGSQLPAESPRLADRFLNTEPTEVQILFCFLVWKPPFCFPNLCHLTSILHPVGRASSFIFATTPSIKGPSLSFCVYVF